MRIHEVYQVKDVQSGNVNSVWLTNVEKKKKNSSIEKWAKDLQGQLSQEDIYMCMWKGAQYPVLREVERKWHTSTHLLDWPQSRMLTVPNAGEDVEQQQLLPTAGGDGQWCSYAGRWCAFSHRTECNCTVRPSNHTPWYLSTGIEYYVQIKTCTQTNIAALFTIDKTWK